MLVKGATEVNELTYHSRFFLAPWGALEDTGGVSAEMRTGVVVDTEEINIHGSNGCVPV